MSTSSPPKEPTNAAIESLLRHHMQESARDREERAARDERIFAKMGAMQSGMQNLQAKVTELDTRQQRVEEKADNAHELARQAINSNADLEGTMMRELGQVGASVATLRADTSAQNRVLALQDKALADIKAGTDSLVKAEAFRHQEIEAWSRRRDRWTAWAKFMAATVGAISVIAAAVWAIFTFAVQHAR